MIEICSECKTSIAATEKPAVHTRTGALCHQSCLHGADVLFFNEVPNLRPSRVEINAGIAQEKARAAAGLAPLPEPIPVIKPVPAHAAVHSYKTYPEDAAKHWIQARRPDQDMDMAVEPFNLQPSMIHVQSIAHSLGFLCRYTGHTTRFYSVAQHSIGVSRLVKALGGGLKAQLWGLLHDSGESMMNDIAAPMKSHPIFEGYRGLEKEIDAKIRRVFGLSIINPEDLKLVKHADMAMIGPEKKNLLGKEPRPWMPINQLTEAHAVFDEVDAMVPHSTPHMFAETFLAEYSYLILAMASA
jgi:uncharacterized protein